MVGRTRIASAVRVCFSTAGTLRSAATASTAAPPQSYPHQRECFCLHELAMVPGMLTLLVAATVMASAEAAAAANATAPPAVPPPKRTPVMGWNAWNTFSTNGKPMRGGRKEYQTVADAMVESGMVAAGYTLLSTVCTGWQGRDPVTHELQENLTNWPGGMKSFATYLHTKGMQLSVYTDTGAQNCCGEPGSLGFGRENGIFF